MKYDKLLFSYLFQQLELSLSENSYLGLTEACIIFKTVSSSLLFNRNREHLF